MKNKLLSNIFLVALSCCSCAKNNNSINFSNNSDSTKKDSLVSVEVEYVRNTYSNPCKIIDDNGEEQIVSIADPDLLLADDGYYYLYPTNTTVFKGDRGKVFDRGPIFRSSNLTDWTWVGSVFDDYPEAGNWGTNGAQIWAPGIVKIGDMYNYYYSLSTFGDHNPGIGVATSPTPYGPWTHYGKVIDSKDSGVENGIDPQVLVEDDGRVFLIWGSFLGIAGIELTIDGIEPIDGSDYKKNVKWIIKNNSNGSFNTSTNYEGSYIIKRNGYYYYFGSQGSCCSGSKSTYNVKVGISDNLFGPYKSSEGISLYDEPYGDVVIAPDSNTAGVGHNAVIKDYAGDYWLVYHGYDINGPIPEERSLYIDKLLWDENTLMPYVDGKVASTTEKEGPLIIKK